jgi:hypothetical protein
MGIILILLVVLAILVALIAAVLFIPVDLSIRLIKEGLTAEGKLSFGILEGAASGHVDFSSEKQEFRLCVLGFTVLRRPLKKKEDEEKKRKEKRKKEKPTDWKKIVGNANELYSAGKELAGALTNNISLKRLTGRAEIGLSDPAQTGMLIGFLYAGSGIATAFLPKTSLEFAPSFEAEKVDAEVELELSLPLFKMVIPAIRFFRRTRKIF